MGPSAGAVTTGHGGGYPDPTATTPPAPNMGAYNGYGATTPAAPDMGDYNGNNVPAQAPAPGELAPMTGAPATSPATAAPLGVSRNVQPREEPGPGPCFNTVDCETTITFEVTTGALFVTVPGPGEVEIGSTDTVPDTLHDQIGECEVVDNRGEPTGDAAWTVTADMLGNWVATAGANSETNPPEELTLTQAPTTYNSGEVDGTNITINSPPADTDVPLSDTPADVITAGPGAGGVNHATWDPTITVDVPSTASPATYTNTLSTTVI